MMMMRGVGGGRSSDVVGGCFGEMGLETRGYEVLGLGGAGGERGRGWGMAWWEDVFVGCDIPSFLHHLVFLLFIFGGLWIRTYVPVITTRMIYCVVSNSLWLERLGWVGLGWLYDSLRGFRWLFFFFLVLLHWVGEWFRLAVGMGWDYERFWIKLAHQGVFASFCSFA